MKIKIKKLIPQVLFALCLAACLCGSPFLPCLGPPLQPRGYSDWWDGRDGQWYRVRNYGGKTWMTKNLNFATDEGSWCYDNDVANCEIYGRLYDWETAMTACPQGWRLPTDEDWQALINSVGGDSIAGTKLKSSTGWKENGNGTDDFGFSALPGGLRYTDDRDTDGSFLNVGLRGYWWTSTERDTTRAWNRVMFYEGEHVGYGGNNKALGLSVRCVRE